MQFDERSSCLRIAEHVNMFPLSQLPPTSAVRRTARLLATHPRKRMVAVASLQSLISVFPVLFLPKRVNAGKIASVDVDGTILSIDFLEDDEGVPGDAILVALLQKGKEQVIALYTVGVPPDSSGGLSITYVGSMITCATHPDDVAVARATSQLTGESVRPTPPAAAVTRLTGCPFLFAVFVENKIIAGDARSVIINAHASDNPLTSRRDDLFSRQQDERRLTDRVVSRLVEETPIPHDDMDFTNSTPEAPVSLAGPDTSGVHTPGSSAGGSDSGNTHGQEGFVTPTQTPAARPTEPPAVNFHRRSTFWRSGNPPAFPLLTRRVMSRYPYTGQSDFSIDSDYMSYLFVPPYITLDAGVENGVATAWVDARDHFCDEHGDGSGLYFVMESGAMFVLRWSDSVREGTTTFRIPGGDRIRTAPKRNFSVEYVGDVGPARSIAALDQKLIFVANDAADGSLRQLRLPSEQQKQQAPKTVQPACCGVNLGMLQYGLDVRQEFLNMCPIIDFVISPSQGDVSKSTRREQPRTRPDPPGYSSGSSMDHHIENLDLADPLSNQIPIHQTALEHVIHGSDAESEIIACTGTGRQGCIRIIRPGAPVSVLAASPPAFRACNDIWPLQFTKDASFDTGLLLTFAEMTGLFLTVPPEGIGHHSRQPLENSVVAQLVDGTDAVGILSTCRTIELGRIEDGVVAQIYEKGIRFIFMKKACDVDLIGKIVNNSVRESLYSKILDWHPPEEGTISVGTIGAGFILVSLVRPHGLKPILYLLKCFPSEPTRGLYIVASAILDHELSCIKVPEWTVTHSDHDISSPRLPPMVILGTYAPSIEVRLLGPTLEVVDCRATRPWDIRADGGTERPESAAHGNEMRGASTHMNTNPPGELDQDLVKSYIHANTMTAVPESICALELDHRRLVMAGLRDGSVICFSFGEEDDMDIVAPDSPNAAGHLVLELHRKLGYRPVVVKPVTVAIGRVLLCQTERLWMCTSHGGRKLRWTPLAFPETNASCSFSVFGAERCFAAVAEDDSLYICSLRRKSEVSVRSILVGHTPRRVAQAPTLRNCVVVATVMEHNAVKDDENPQANLASMSESSQLQVYSKRTRKRLGKISLLSGELVHVLTKWNDFLVVGTSWGLRDLGPHDKCLRGRLLLYSLRSVTKKGSSGHGEERVQFQLCTELVLPGAVLAGCPHPSADMLAISCNADIILLALVPSKDSLVEIARASVRTLVMSLSVQEDMICVVDRKDSVAFFQIHAGVEKLVRDRSDFRKRVVSDAVLIDRGQMIGVDRLGNLFSLGYEELDAPRRVEVLKKDGSVNSPYISVVMAMETEGDRIIASQDSASQDAIPSTLGQEYDEMPPEIGSDYSATTPEATGLLTPSDNMDVGHEIGDVHGIEEVHMEESDNADNEDSEGSDVANIEDNENDDDNLDVEDMGGVIGAVQVVVAPEQPIAESIDPEQDPRHHGVPRNLVCYHSFNMNDIAMRLNVGCFSRSEKVNEMEDWELEGERLSTMAEKPFFNRRSEAVFCGTVNGALMCAVSMSSEAYELLSAVEREVSKLSEVGGRKSGCTHERFRSAYGRPAMYCVDGDLLDEFDQLGASLKRGIAASVGCEGEKGVLRIEGTIRDLYDRVG
ncbi:CPSF A subunit [Gracilaria domingensis]|nr:CPSF A subunit [Gracilaria domingensis]